MSLIVLMYHRALAGRHGNSPEILEAHFAHVASNYSNVLPGDPLQSDKLNVCLSFDDGYFDFYTTVFPLLRKFRLRALLAIPPCLIQKRVDASSDQRLKVGTEDAFANPAKGGFCTWPELKEIADSGCVTIAAHGLTHTRLDEPKAGFLFEIDAPQKMLRARVAQRVESFVFPFGRYSPQSLRLARETYRYVFRIGGALNRGWGNRLLYRVDADAMESPSSLFSPPRLARYRARYLWNRLRFR